MKHILFALTLVWLTGTVSAQKRIVKHKINKIGTEFYIKNVAAQKYLDLPGGGIHAKRDNGTNLQLWDMDGGRDRIYKLKDAGDGYVYIMPQHCNSRLDVEGCWPDKWFCQTYKNKKGAPIQIWKFDTNHVGHWKLKQIRKGQFVVINRYSKKVLDAAGSSGHKNGCAVIQWDQKNSDNQLWEFIEVKTGQRYEE
jgi:hypothetical protein